MENFGKICFVCEAALKTDEYSFNPKVNLPVCHQCKGSEAEQIKTDELLEGLAERFVCGCI